MISSSGVLSSATSGSRWRAQKIHEFDGPLFLEPKTRIAKNLPLACEIAAVCTTVNELTFAIRAIADQTQWCLIIVGDISTPHAGYIGLERLYPQRVKYLSYNEQLKLPYEIVSLIPTRHFGRKNIGYLYAAHCGATTIFDFDDDNLILNVTNTLSLVRTLHQRGDKKNYEIIVSPPRPQGSNTTNNKEKFCFYNPYAERFGAKQSWPRGFPLDLINNEYNFKVNKAPQHINFNSIHGLGIIQGLANHDPDVDAIYRLGPRTSLPLPFSFKKEGNNFIALDQDIFAPFNAQATLWHREAYFALFLPITVHGRVSDIWRSYISQLALWCNNLIIAFSDSIVRQERNEHDYLADYMSERPLYEQTHEFVKLIYNQDLCDITTSAAQVIEKSYIKLYEYGFLGRDDIRYAQTWLRDLSRLGVFDSIMTAASAVSHTSTDINILEIPKPLIALSGINESLQNLPMIPTIMDAKRSNLLNEVSLLMAMHDRSVMEYWQFFVPSLWVMWPNIPKGNVIILITAGPYASRLKDKFVDKWPFPKVIILPDLRFSPSGHQMSGKLSAQGHYFYADKYVETKFAGFIDPDAMFTSPVTTDALFHVDGRPRAQGQIWSPGGGFWNITKKQDQWVLNTTSTLRSMSYFPVIVRIKDLPDLRNGISVLHENKSFDEVWHLPEHDPHVNFHCGFCIIMSWLWLNKHSDYKWHIEPLSLRPNSWEFNQWNRVDEDDKEQYVRVCLHVPYSNYWKKGHGVPHVIERDKFLRVGWCLGGGLVYDFSPSTNATNRCLYFLQSQSELPGLNWLHATFEFVNEVKEVPQLWAIALREFYERKWHNLKAAAPSEDLKAAWQQAYDIIKDQWLRQDILEVWHIQPIIMPMTT